MKTAEVMETSKGQVVQLPDEFRFRTNRVWIRRQGDGVLLEPIKPAQWPEGSSMPSISMTPPSPGPTRARFVADSRDREHQRIQPRSRADAGKLGDLTTRG